MVEDRSFSVRSGFTYGYFSFPSKKPRHSKMSDGDVQKISTADPEDEPLKENVVQRKLHEYFSQFNFNLLHAMPALERRGEQDLSFVS